MFGNLVSPMKSLFNSVKFRRISSFYRLPGLICLQLIVVLIFILLGTLISNSVEITDSWIDVGVKFIKNSPADKSLNLEKNETLKIYSTPTFMKIRKNVDFNREFHVFQRNVQISSDISDSLQITHNCFIKGTESSSNRALQVETNKTENGVFDSRTCICKPGWHGISCSEPEIVWRAFLKSRQPLSQPPKISRNPHHVFYIISNVSLVTMETLEIQILELVDIVNVFILCDKISSDEPSLLIRRQMNSGFLQTFQEQILLIKDLTCSRMNILRQMRKTFGSQMKPLDVLIFGNTDEILNKKAIDYLKWHNHWPQPLVFRMRWNVFGFFFQHPENTILRTFACQLNVLEQVYKANPDNIIKRYSELLTIGDLNHFGGWFCEYCYQPIDIIKKFHLDSKLLANKSSTSLLNGSYHRKPTINIEFIQNLIQHGIYIDGSTTLNKVRSYENEKYFVPEYVAKNRWKFENAVSNFYASWDDPESDGYW